MPNLSHNPYLAGKVRVIFARTALPIIFVMSMNGLLTVADAHFLGHYVGAQALAAVTLTFPFYMLMLAIATLVASGMSSLLARHLGAGRLQAASTVYASAHWLALALGAVLIALFTLFGDPVLRLAAGGDLQLAGLAGIYLQILLVFSPLLFVLTVNSDALRNEGHVGVMAAMGLLVSLSNIGFNYLLIAILKLGVAGSAYGTVLAQALALGIILSYRQRGGSALRPGAVLRQITTTGWLRMLALGAPQSLNFIGIALGASAIIAALQIAHAADYSVSITAYGIVTRVLTFAVLPLLGLSQAMQTITGNNHGAGLWQRSNASLRFALGAALLFCAAVQWLLTLFAPAIGRAFVDDPRVAAEVAAIMSRLLTLFLVSGPLMMVATHFQAIGDAARAAILGLSKPYLFAIPLTFALPLLYGERAIWWAAPSAEALLLGLTTIVLWQTARRHSLRWGLFRMPGEGLS